MPYKDKEKEKEYSRLWRENNKEYLKEYDKKRKENNKEYHKQQCKEYLKTEKGLKSHTISRWKNRGIINDDFNSLYEYYLNCKNCEECNVELTSGKYGSNHKCLDHDHKTGLFRNVLCNTCNVKRGFIEKGTYKLTGAEVYWKKELRKFIFS